MKLVMTLLCRDEADIVEANIRFHLEQGVDHIIAMNNLSRDETVDILQAYERSGVLTLINQEADTFDQDRWVTRMARTATSRYRADWVINNDADEFWWPRQGGLKEVLATLPSTIEMMSVPRNNFLPSRNEAGPFHERMRIRETASRTVLGHPLPAKVCHRGFTDIDVSSGNHSAQRGETPLRMIDGSLQIDILHFPVRTYAQLERKIMLGATALSRNQRLDPGTGVTWRWLLEEYNQGRLYDFYQRQALDQAAVNLGLESGTLVRDDRLYEYFRLRPGAAK